VFLPQQAQSIGSLLCLALQGYGYAEKKLYIRALTEAWQVLSALGPAPAQWQTPPP